MILTNILPPSIAGCIKSWQHAQGIKARTLGSTDEQWGKNYEAVEEKYLRRMTMNITKKQTEMQIEGILWNFQKRNAIKDKFLGTHGAYVAACDALSVLQSLGLISEEKLTKLCEQLRDDI